MASSHSTTMTRIRTAIRGRMDTMDAPLKGKARGGMLQTIRSILTSILTSMVIFICQSRQRRQRRPRYLSYPSHLYGCSRNTVLLTVSRFALNSPLPGRTAIHTTRHTERQTTGDTVVAITVRRRRLDTLHTQRRTVTTVREVWRLTAPRCTG